MIIKILSRQTPSYKQLLEYILDKDRHRLLNTEEQSFLITHNLKGKSIEQWTKQFKKNEEHRKIKRTDSVYLYHEILSWHDDDAKNLTRENMEDMAREYLKLRNPNGIYVAVPHFDKGHFHVHICASGIEYKTGKSLRLSQANLLKLKKSIEAFQIEKYPMLSHSIVQHGKGGRNRMTHAEYQMKQRTKRMTDKEIVLGILNTCYKQVNSREDFFKRLKKCELSIYMRNGRLTGIVHKNRKYRLERLGFVDKQLEYLAISSGRNKELRELRNNRKAELKKDLNR